MKLVAQHNYVVVKLAEAEIKEHASGLSLTALDDERQPYGTITSVGPNCRIPEFVEGASVLIPTIGGETFRDNLDTYLIFLDHEIYGIIT